LHSRIYTSEKGIARLTKRLTPPRQDTMVSAMLKRYLRLTISLLSGIVFSAQTVNNQTVITPSSPLAGLIDRYSADRNSLLRRYGVDYSPERYARLTRFYKEWHQDLVNVPFESLSVEGRIDYVLLRSRLEYELRLLGREQQWVDETVALLPFAKAITDLLEARWRLETMQPEKAAATLDQINNLSSASPARPGRTPATSRNAPALRHAPAAAIRSSSAVFRQCIPRRTGSAPRRTLRRCERWRAIP
jgi:hypothetical protein